MMIDPGPGTGNANLFAALRPAFPPDLSGVAVETDSGLCYSWSDLERASAMLANLMQSLDLPAGSVVVVCTKQNFGWLSRLAFQSGTQHVFALNADRSGSLLTRSAQCANRHVVAVKAAGDVVAIVYTSGTTGRSKQRQPCSWVCPRATCACWPSPSWTFRRRAICGCFCAARLRC